MRGTEPPQLRPTATLQEPESSRLRPTTWPGQPIPPRRVTRPDARLVEVGEAKIAAIEYMFEEATDVDLPEDFVLREIFDVKISPDALTSFIARWGPLTGWGSQRMSLIPGPIPNYIRRDLSQLEPEFPTHGPRTTWMVPISVIELHVKTLRAMASQLRMYLDKSTGDYTRAWTENGLNTPASESQSWLWFDLAINTALRPFHANVQFSPYGALTGATQTPTAYEACALQLYNYVAEGAPFGICANENCSRWFTRQRGRAQYGHNRTSGVRYCSHHCAKAQGERERRRRRRVDKKPF
jgi:hypothetical protein